MSNARTLITIGMFGLLRVATGATVAADNASDVVAEIGGHKVTRAELEQKKAAKLFQARNQLYIAERDALNQFIDDQLLEEKAQAEHLSVEQLVQRDIISHISDPTEDQLQVYYEGLGTDEPFATVREKILGHIHELRVSKARSEYLKDLRNQFSVLVTLSPPSAHVSLEGAEIRGPKNPSVTLIEFADYECPYCQKVAPDVKKLKADFGDKLTLTYKDFPLPMHARAEKAAEATRCASKQGKYWELHDEIFRSKELDVDQLKAQARALKLDATEFDKCLDSGEEAAVVETDRKEGARLGINGTPAFFINGHFLSGAVDYAALREIVEQQLAAQTHSGGNAGSK
jgi:predicted DsbA family dithiol-disulfide isomerase